MWTNRRSAFPRPGSPLEERELILPATHATAALGTHMPPNYPSNHHSLIIHIVHRQMFEKGIHQYHWCHWNTNSESKIHFQLLKMWPTSVYFSRSSILHSFFALIQRWVLSEEEKRHVCAVIWLLHMAAGDSVYSHVAVVMRCRCGQGDTVSLCKR